MKVTRLRPRAIRALAFFGSIALILAVFVVRMVQLQVVQHDEWNRRSESNHQSRRILEMKRGSISDRNGVEFALSVETYTVFLFTRELKSLPEAATILSTFLPMTRDEIIAKVGGRQGYLPIYKNLERSLATKILKMKIPGVILEENYRRVYPQNSLAANLIGFAGTDGHGLEGMELSFDRTLRGYTGLAVQEDVSFGEDGPASIRIVQPPMGGNNLVLTIDSFIQHILETELAKIMNQYKPIDATAVAMDPQSGEILGLACLPSYDLNSFATSEPDSHRNRPLVDFFEPGSCMKIFPVGLGLETGKLTSSSRFYCRGGIEIAGRRIRCHGSHGLVDIDKAIAESCNATMIQISQILDPRQLFRKYRQLGFGEATGLEVPAETNGLFAPPSRWSALSAPSLCIGQEIAVTDLQLVSAYSAIANGGWLMQPRLVKRIISQSGDIVEDFQPVQKRQVFSPEIAKRLRQMLRGVVETGTGKLARLPDYSIGGKTSTAQKANPKGGYFHEKVVASFIGMAPAIDPRVVLLVAVNEPKGDEETLYGGKVAAPFFSIILDRILKHMKVPPDRIQTIGLASDSLPAAESGGDSGSILISRGGSQMGSFQSAAPAFLSRMTIPSQAMIPDFSGMTLKQVARKARELNLQTRLIGSGRACDQTPRSGTAIDSSTVVQVKFSSRM